MAVVIFRIRGIGETASIKIRFKHSSFDYEFSTGMKVNRNVWSNKQQRVKNMIEAPYREKLNKKLNELRVYVMNSYYDASFSNTSLTKLWLRKTVSEFLNEPMNRGDESGEYDNNFDKIDDQTVINEWMNSLREQGADDQEIQVFECWTAGINTPREIKEYCEISIDKIYNIYKRLRRKKIKFGQKWLNLKKQ